MEFVIEGKAYTTFQQLNIGELFMTPQMDIVYMKVKDNPMGNVVRLDTGRLPSFMPDDFVIPVDGKLIVTRKDVRSE